MLCDGNPPPPLTLLAAAAAAAAIAFAGSEVFPPPRVTGHKVNIPAVEDVVGAIVEPEGCCCSGRLV